MSSQPANATGNPLLQSYQAWSERTPFITRTSTIVLIVLYIISFFIRLELYLSNIPYYTILSFELYRILFSPLIGNSIFTLILILFSYPALGKKMESSMGSGSFLFLLNTLSLIINVSFNVICFMFYLIGISGALFYDCSNFWVVLFALISIDCFTIPDAPRRLLFIPYDIPSKYIPLALYGIVCLFSGSVYLSYGLSIAVGYASSKGMLDRFKPSSYYLEQLEQPGGMLHSVSRSPGWVLAGASLGHDSWIPVNQADPDMPSTSSHSSHGSSGTGNFNFGGTVAAEQDKPKEKFAGTGRKLSDQSSSQSATTFSNFSMPTVTAPPVETLSREEIAARRLAALSNNNKV